MIRTLSLLTVLSTASCTVVQDSDRTDAPIGVGDDCDADGDGFLDAACGGDDCDDDDATIYPGAPQTFGEDVDRNCDGQTFVQLDRFQAPERTTPLTWRWGSDLRSLGGLIVLPTGELVAQDLYFDEPFGGRVILKRRSDYGPALDATMGARLEGPVDVLFREGHVEVWSPEENIGEQLVSVAWPTLHELDATHAAEHTWIAGCDGEHALAERLDLLQRVPPERYTLDRAATACAVLGPARDGRPILLTFTPGEGLERWVLDPDLGFTDRLRLADHAMPEKVRTASQEANAAMAFLQKGELYVFNRGGDGLILGEQVSDRFDLAIAPDGEMLITWLDTEDHLWMALGGPPFPPPAHRIAHLPGATAVSAGLDDHEVAVAVHQGPDLVFARALRP